MEHVETLAWDTGQFGYPIVRLTPPSLPAPALRETLAGLRRRGVRLAYWTVSPDDAVANDAAESSGGRLADRKVTYAAELPETPASATIDVHVHSYLHRDVSPRLLSLAYQSGVHSRFNTDPGFQHGEFQSLYRTWIASSLAGSIARDVLVYVDETGREIGLLTLGEKGGRADIGLLAVDAEARGKSVGAILVRASFVRARGWGHTGMQVVTQTANVPACRFYEKQGFVVERVDHVYHFWLGRSQGC